MPLRHLVFFEIINKKEKVDLIHDSLKNLSREMPGCFQFNFGHCEGDYYHFFMDFDNEESRNRYLAHPKHEKIAKEVIIPNLKNGLQSVIVFDHTKEGQNNVSKLKKAEGTSGYILLKEKHVPTALQELVEHCDRINHAKPLMNCSIEDLGKEYPYAMRIKFKSDAKPLKIKDGVSFWTTKDIDNSNKEDNFETSKSSDVTIKSKL